MANEEASSPSISADDTGSDSYNESSSEMRHVNFREAAVAKIGYSDELLKDSSGELSLDAEFPTPGDYLSDCPDCCYPRRTGSPLRPGSPQHTEYCINMFVRPGNETSSMDRQGHLSELQDPSLSATAVDPSTLATSTAIPADASEDVAGESYHTDEPDIAPSSIQPHSPHDTDIQPQPAMKFERHIYNDVISLDEPGNRSSECPACQKDFTHSRADSLKRHIKEAHAKGDHPCPYAECRKSKDPFKRSDKLQNHLKTCKYALQSKRRGSPS
ncbi:hypothetical protein MKX08_009860 [Trichoderma sp. CBMAI-0020]|nr:hypothetical protein MKX08_009860 [Trichoderma sp. CBMAI-0020]